MRLEHPRRAGLVALCVLIAAAAGGVAYAATTTTAPQVVYACSNSSGTLRLLSSGRCPSGYVKISMNRQGPRGLTGPRGSTGPAGPGATTVRVTSDTVATSSSDRIIAGTGLTLHAVCNAGQAGTSSGIYLLDTSASADYTVSGSYDLTAPGAHGFLVYDGGSHPNLAAGLGLIEFTQPAALNANGEFVLQYDTGTGGLMTADVTVTRSGHKVLLHLLLSQAASHCVAQANITPAA